MTEEERAAAYREQCRRRAASHRQQCAALAGDPAARQQLEENWAPLRDWMRERPTTRTKFFPTDSRI